MRKLSDLVRAVSVIENGASIMIGGFMCCGQPFGLIDAMIEKDIGDLTVVCNDAGYPGKGVGKLVEQGRIKHLITSHIGLNPIAGKKMHAGEMKVELVPQGTLVERIRAWGAGLGGILTPTGLGTEVEKGKQKCRIGEVDYLIEPALGADYALVKADMVDELGNGFIGKAQKNFNIVMAMAARHAIVETGKVVAVGDIGTDQVNLPGIFIKTVVEVARG
jgi:acetate CoA/acetoacetate CoA-transferase alpha subunit